MNLDLLLYVFKVNVIITLCYALYTLLMASSVSHQINRAYLLLIPALALVIPLIEFGSSSPEQFLGVLPTIDISQTTLVMSKSSWFVWWVLLVVWLIGAGMKLMVSLRQLAELLRQSKSYNGKCSFTFFKTINVSESLPKEVRNKVLIHEQVHADQWHTLDLLWYELFRIVFWFNPLFKLAQHNLKELHEYIADAKTNDQTLAYQETLVAFAFGLNELPLASEFQSVNIKNRIKMMNKTNTKAQIGGVFLSLALAVITVITVSCTAVNMDTEVPDHKVYKEVDQMPVFNGCDASLSKEEVKKCSGEKLMNFMISTVKYPKASEKAGTEGKVFVEFVVDAEGNVKDAKVKKGADKLLDAEAIRVVKAMPKWTPGVHDGKEVSVSLTLPIAFKL